MIVNEQLVQIEHGRQLKRMRAGLHIHTARFGFGKHFEAFHPERRFLHADLDRTLQQGRRGRRAARQCFAAADADRVLFAACGVFADFYRDFHFHHTVWSGCYGRGAELHVTSLRCGSATVHSSAVSAGERCACSTAR